MSSRFLCVNMNYIGDALMTTPALDRLNKASGELVDVIASRPALEVLRGNRCVGETFDRDSSGAFGRCVQLFKIIRAGNYSNIVILPSIPIYRSTAILAGAKSILFVPQMPAGVHLAAHITRSVEEFLKLAPSEVQLELSVEPVAMQWAISQVRDLPGIGPVVALNIGATRPQKRWPLSHFIDSAEILIGRGNRVIILGSDADRTEANEIARQVATNRVVNLAGKTSIAQLIALINTSDAVITADTAALHIASALNKPLVALFGSTSPEQTGPLAGSNRIVLYDRLACSPCRSRPTCNGRFECMKSLDALRAADAAQSLIDSKIEIGAVSSS